MSTYDNAPPPPDWQPDARPSPFVTVVPKAQFDELMRDDAPGRMSAHLRATVLRKREAVEAHLIRGEN